MGLAENTQQRHEYKQLLVALNDVARYEVDAWLRQQDDLSEPFVARCISEQLPEGQPFKPLHCVHHMSRQKGFMLLRLFSAIPGVQKLTCTV